MKKMLRLLIVCIFVITIFAGYGGNPSQIARLYIGITSSGTTDTFTNPLEIPTYDGSNQAVHPSVLYFPDKWNGYEYWMAYTPYPDSNDDYENPSIAVSNDGINWITPGGLSNPIDIPTAGQLADGYHMSDTELLMANGTMECWYRFNINGGTEQLMRKTSQDGINWSDREVVLDLTNTGNLALSPSVYEYGKYKLWYCDADSKIYYTESATAELGSWSPEIEVQLSFRDSAYIPWHLDVMADSGKYIVILNTVLDSDGHRYLLAGESDDGLSFSDLHLVLSPSATGWDNKELYRASVVKAGDVYRMYYSAMSDQGKWHIGLAHGNSLDSLSNIYYTLSFDSNEGTAVPNQQVGNNSSALKPSPTRTGYTFAGWYKEPECINEWDFTNDRLTENTTLYAKWTDKMNVLAGADRYATAVEISKAGYDSADTAVLATGMNFPDALAAGPLAVQEGAPVMLTQTNSVPQSTLDELKRLNVKKVIIMGGEDVVAPAEVTVLTGMGISVERVSGSDRYGTAVEAAKKVRAKSAVTDKIALATGLNFPDALCIGSYASKEGIPILLTEANALTASTKAAITEFGIKQVVIAGGADVLSKSVENELTAMGITVTRSSGDTRYGTSVDIAGRFFPGSVNAIAATGLNYPDALAAVPLAAKMNSPVILVEKDAVPSEVSAYLRNSKIAHITVVGDDEAVGQAVKKELMNLLK
jgi:uncharacterized repeat protein (TIGR02543 family)